MIPAKALRFLLTLVATLALASTAQARDLADLVREGGVDWLMGKWKGETDSGDTISLSYEWALSPSLAVLNYKDPNDESHALIYVDPADSKVRHLGVGRKGGVGSGEWMAENGVATLRYTAREVSGETRKMAFVHRKVDADTLEVAVYELKSDGQLGDSAWATIRFKRQK